MKKLLILLISLSTVASAQNINLYGKFGFDFNSRYSNTSEIDEEDGLEMGLGFPKKGKNSLGIFLEATKNITPNFELGIGLGYIDRKGSNTEILTGKSTEEINGKTNTYYTYDKYKAPRYNSFPLYITAKYNFNVESNLRPYIKFDLGYSINKIKSSINAQSIEYKDVPKVEEEYKIGLKAKNGLYTGIGAGLEYNNFLVELAYIHTNAKIKATWTGDDFIGGKSTETFKQKNAALRLLVGYKFNF